MVIGHLRTTVVPLSAVQSQGTHILTQETKVEGICKGFVQGCLWLTVEGKQTFATHECEG